MPMLFSVVPLVHKLLTIVSDIAKKNGHVIEDFSQERRTTEDLYTAKCRVCAADVKIMCSVHGYNRTGTAFEYLCKPG